MLRRHLRQDAGLRFSKGRGPEPCGSLKSGCYHAWEQEPEVCVLGRITLFCWSQSTSPPCRLKEAPAFRAQWHVNAASQRDVPPCLHWCLLRCFSANLRPLTQLSSSLGQLGRSHFSEGTSQPSDCRAWGKDMCSPPSPATLLL